MENMMEKQATRPMMANLDDVTRGAVMEMGKSCGKTPATMAGELIAKGIEALRAEAAAAAKAA